MKTFIVTLLFLFTLQTGAQQYTCSGSNDTEDIQCSTLSCPEGNVYHSRTKFDGINIALDQGENGSDFGRANIIGFRMTGTFTNLTQAGRDGDSGVDNLSSMIPTEQTSCTKIEDESFWKNLWAGGFNPDPNAEYRSSPILTVVELLFRPITVTVPNKGKKQYAEPTVNSAKVYTHTDYNVRKLIFRIESQ